MIKKICDLSIGDTVLLPFNGSGCLTLEEKANFYKEATLTAINTDGYYFGLNNVEKIKYCSKTPNNNKFPFFKILTAFDCSRIDVATVHSYNNNYLLHLATGMLASAILNKKNNAVKEMVSSL